MTHVRRLVPRDTGVAYTLLAPALLLLAAWFVVPIAQTFVLSLQSVNQFHFSQRQYIGLDNFAQLLADPAFDNSVSITLTFVAFVVPVQTVLAIVIAAVLQSVRRGRTIFRTAYFVPYMASTVAVTTVFMQLFAVGGPAANLGTAAGVPNVTWYADVNLAVPFLALVYVYMYVGLYIVTFVGGMESIPRELYEAAMVDGAGALSRFRHVTIPGLRPFLVFVLVAGLIQALQVFDQAYVISNGTILGSPAGATSTLVIFIYQQAFRLNNLGYGAAAAVLLLVIVFTGTVLMRRLVREASA